MSDANDVNDANPDADEARAPVAGTILDGRWRLRRPLAAGGMGAVWVGEHVTLGEPVAIKLMQLDRDDPLAAERVSRFQLEARLAAELGARSRHVVRVFDHGVVGELAYLVSELVEGETLESMIAREGRLPAARVVAVVGQLAKALGVVHAAGVIHRDLKPSNVALTLDEDGQVLARLIDFGIAKAKITRHRTRRGVVLGTPSLMSPEQAMGLPIDGRADVWALACIAYEALTGRPVVEGDAVEDLLCRICAFDLAPLRGDVPLPAPLRDLFAIAFARDVDARFPDATSLARALELACATSRAATQGQGRGRRRRISALDPALDPLDPVMDASGARARIDVVGRLADVAPLDPAIPLRRLAK